MMRNLYELPKEVFLFPVRQLEYMSNSAICATGAMLTHLEQTYGMVQQEPEKLEVWRAAEKLQFELRRNALRGIEFGWYHRHMNQNYQVGRSDKEIFSFPIFNLHTMIRGFVKGINHFLHGSVCGRVTDTTAGIYVAADINRVYFMLSILLAGVLNGDPDHMGFAMETAVSDEDRTVTLSISREQYSVPEQYRGLLCPYKDTPDQKSDDILLEIFQSCFNARVQRNNRKNKPSVLLTFPLARPVVENTGDDPVLWSRESDTLDDSMGIAGTMLSSIMPATVIFGRF